MDTQTCPHCRQTFAGSPRDGNRCPLCGARLDDLPLATFAGGAEDTAPPDAALPPISPDAKKQIVSDIIFSGLIGAAIGYWSGSLLDPKDTGSAASAVAMFLLFAGWGIVECLGAVLARNLRIARRRGGMILAAAICGGIYVGICIAIGWGRDADAATPIAVTVGVAFVFGFLLGAAISAVSTIKLAGTLAANLSPPGGTEPPPPPFPPSG